ncbi:MAG: sugar isomerase [Thermofilum sp. ex4484_79]|nr:MAG: sugar isomerase [Thermofilum sp. ex4484_79]
MRVTESLLKRIEEKYTGYLKGEILDEFFSDFEIKFAAGHWAAGDFLDRFATTGYWPELNSSLEEQIKRVADAKVKGIEFHDVLFLKDNLDIDEDKIIETKGLLEKYGISPTTMNINMFTDPKWKYGSVTNPQKELREEAYNRLLLAADIARKVDCEAFSFWPGQDGWDYNFESNYGKKFEWFYEAVLEAAKRAKQLGLKFGIEAKLKEPKEGNMIVPTTQMAGWIAYRVNSELNGKYMGVTIDYGHEQMYGVEPAFTVYVLHKMDVPIANFHVNTAKLRSNDEDRIFGTGDVWRFIDYLYAAVDIGYDGWFAEDQFTYRMDPVKAMYLGKELFGNLMKKALLIYSRRKELEEARENNDQAAVIDIVKEIIFNK